MVSSPSPKHRVKVVASMSRKRWPKVERVTPVEKLSRSALLGSREHVLLLAAEPLGVVLQDGDLGVSDEALDHRRHGHRVAEDLGPGN